MWKQTALRKRVSATTSDAMAVQRLHSSCVSDAMVSVAALVLVSPGLDQSVACSLPQYEVMDLQSIPKPEIFW